MAYSSAKTVAQYLASLPAERRRAIAANYALYLTCAYSDPAQGVWLRNQFKRLEDLSLDAIGQVISSTPVEKQIAMYEASRRR
ncbi:MAG TPA: hypothetical protein VFB95_07475 [Candidatus Cryosericum sp.]|nr:hypothetical protein [Candidatus Cryosericum sp.]